MSVTATARLWREGEDALVTLGWSVLTGAGSRRAFPMVWGKQRLACDAMSGGVVGGGARDLRALREMLAWNDGQDEAVDRRRRHRSAVCELDLDRRDVGADVTLDELSRGAV